MKLKEDRTKGPKNIYYKAQQTTCCAFFFLFFKLKKEALHLNIT